MRGTIPAPALVIEPQWRQFLYLIKVRLFWRIRTEPREETRRDMFGRVRASASSADSLEGSPSQILKHDSFSIYGMFSVAKVCFSRRFSSGNFQHLCPYMCDSIWAIRIICCLGWDRGLIYINFLPLCLKNFRTQWLGISVSVAKMRALAEVMKHSRKKAKTKRS